MSSLLPAQRITFAHSLRGIACLSVLFGHLVLTFGALPEVVTGLTGLETPIRKSGTLAAILSHSPISFGVFGVAVFFLVSGLVIPLSLERQDRASFVVARFFRLVPTYACCLGITLLGLSAVHAWLGQSYAISWRNVLAHVALVRDLLWLPSIDGVVWTLEVEAKYYVLCLVLVPLIRAADARGILLWNTLIAGVVVWLGSVPETVASADVRAYAALRAVQLTGLCMTFMWMGTLLCFHHQGRRSTGQTFAGMAILNAQFLVQAFASDVFAGPNRMVIVVTYQAALTTVVTAYFFPGIMPSWKWLHRLADISYPLYALHGALGYATEIAIYRLTGNLYVSMAGAAALMIGLAFIVHRYVERPTQALGKRLAARAARPHPASSLAAEPARVAAVQRAA